MEILKIEIEKEKANKLKKREQEKFAAKLVIKENQE
jgi:hypothetical protein